MATFCERAAQSVIRMFVFLYFGFDGRAGVLIALVHDHCLFFTFYPRFNVCYFFLQV